MTSKLAPWGARLIAVQPDGTFTAEFSRWLNTQLAARVGGLQAMTNTELSEELNALATLIAGEMVLQPAAGSPLFPDVLQPAQADMQLADVLQTQPFSELGAMTFQV